MPAWLVGGQCAWNNLAEAKDELLVIPQVSRRRAALYAATLSFSAACTIRNVPDKSQLRGIDHSLRKERQSTHRRVFEACSEERHVRSHLRFAVFASLSARLAPLA